VSSQPSLRPSVATLSPSLQPTITAMPTPSATVSAMPSQTPSASSAPSASIQPSLRPSGSTMPSNVPSVSLKPSTSFAPSLRPSTSLLPTITPNPSTSLQPTTCLEQLIPPQWSINGAKDNPFPDGAFEYVSQDVSNVTVKIIQKWSDQNLVWIAPYYEDKNLPDPFRACERFRDIPPLGEVEITVACFSGVSIFNVIVSDNSLVPGSDLNMDGDNDGIPGCQSADDDVLEKKVLYAFDVKCTPPPASCSDVIL
jgi:hypothetical protein